MRKGKKGEVWKMVDKQGKPRPVVIVNNMDIVAELDHSVATVTSKGQRNKYDVVLEDWEQAGLDVPSVVRCSKINTIYHNDLIHKYGDLSESDLANVIETIKSYF
jgi:mRNA interferase MazF